MIEFYEIRKGPTGTVIIWHINISPSCKRIEAEWRIYASVSKAIIGSDNGWSAPCHYLNQCWNIANSKLRNTLQWNLKWSEIHTFSFTKMHLEMSSAKWRQFCLGLNVIMQSEQAFLWCVFSHWAVECHFVNKWCFSPTTVCRKSLDRIALMGIHAQINSRSKLCFAVIIIVTQLLSCCSKCAHMPKGPNLQRVDG